MFPGITPWNVWDLPFWLWLQYADAADEWLKVQKKKGPDHG